MILGFLVILRGPFLGRFALADVCPDVAPAKARARSCRLMRRGLLERGGPLTPRLTGRPSRGHGQRAYIANSPIRTAPAARARFVFRAGRAGAPGWTISKIVFEAQRVLLHRLDKLSCVPVPKWHNLAGFHFGGWVQRGPPRSRRERPPIPRPW